MQQEGLHLIGPEAVVLQPKCEVQHILVGRARMRRDEIRNQVLLLAGFFRDLGLHQAALHNAEQAAQAWQSWGAHALVESLSQRFADLLGPPDSSPEVSLDGHRVTTPITQPITPTQLDLESITTASQLLAAETNLDQLCTKMIALVMANSGAEKAVLLLKQENNWFVQARSDSASEKYDVLLNQPFDPADRESGLIPEPVFNYCRRSREVLVVGDAQLDHRFAEDRMIQKHNIQSMACIPALHQRELKAILYLENRQVADVFTMDRVEILKHLSSQFGVSVENALLYDSLNRKVRELQESEERYELAVSGSAAGLWDWDLRTDKVYYSDRLKELLGYRPDEMLDTQDEFWNRMYPDDYEATRQAVDQHLKERVPYVIDFRLLTKSGEYRWFHARGQALWDETGEPTRMSGSITDLTDRKQAEIELKGAYAEIEHLKNQLEAESAYLKDEIKLEHNFQNIIGQSEALKYVLHRVEQVAPVDSPVLIMGETGTGKELIARAVHELSPHSKRALVKVNCAALPRELIESELFGHEKGAFTGADQKGKAGLFETGHTGTVFLDEIAELRQDVQVKLLEMIEEKTFHRVGGTQAIRVDVRIIAATNRDLAAEVKQKNFREDLFYRLNVVNLEIPPLRDRTGDVPKLAQHFLGEENHRIRLATALGVPYESGPVLTTEHPLDHLVDGTVLLVAADEFQAAAPFVGGKKGEVSQDIQDDMRA